jgi:hypothetical protein
MKTILFGAALVCAAASVASAKPLGSTDGATRALVTAFPELQTSGGTFQVHRVATTNHFEMKRPESYSLGGATIPANAVMKIEAVKHTPATRETMYVVDFGGTHMIVNVDR